MGIRFYCPNGHKLNVKTFLAGKRGICPRCGAKFEIPIESVRAPGERFPTAVAEIEPVGAVAPAAFTTANGANANTGASVPSAAIPSIASAAIPSIAAPSVIPAAVAPAKQAAAGGGPIERPFAPLTAAPLAVAPLTAVPLAAAPLGFTGTTLANASAASPLVSTAPHAAGLPAATNGPLHASAAPADPIAEAPASVWYVRPMSGGQFGPAAGDVMRQWLAQRRVGADSMVWREGWADWKRASIVFPLLFPSATASASATAVSGSAAGGGTSGFADDGDWVEALIDTKPAVGNRTVAHSARSKGKQSNTIVIVSFFLILLCVLLVVVMVTVFMRQNREATDSSGGPRMSPAAAQLAEGLTGRGALQPLVASTATA